MPEKLTRREWQDRWIAALRSGVYRQATEVMQDSKGAMCCLGVAKLIYYGEDAFATYNKTPFAEQIQNLRGDAEIMDAFGFLDKNGVFHDYINGISSFVSANDDHELNFRGIADLAEQHRETVFKMDNED